MLRNISKKPTTVINFLMKLLLFNIIIPVNLKKILDNSL